jgi:hypothetical protein
VVAAGGGDAGVPGHFQDPDAEVSQGSHDLRSAAGRDLGGVFAVADVADLLRGSRQGRTGRLDGSSRSATDQHRVVTLQVLHQAPHPETVSVRTAATTSTTPTEVCCRSSPSGTRCNVVRRAEGPLENGCGAAPRSASGRVSIQRAGPGQPGWRPGW